MSSPSAKLRGRCGLTQTERVQAMLERGWVCGGEFISASPPILRYTGRIHELRRDGFQIDRRACTHPWHEHTARMWQWHIEATPVQAPVLPEVLS